MEWTSTQVATAGSTLAISSMTEHMAVNEAPEPPYSSGTSTPINPLSNKDLMRSGHMVEDSSMEETLGDILSAAN